MPVESFGTQREDIRGSKFKKYQGKEGRIDRVGVLYTDPKKMFRGAQAHFHDRMFLCKSTKEKKEICCLHSYDGKRPKWRIGCLLIIYDLQTEDGKTKLNGFEILPWYFSDKMYNKLKNADKEFSLADHDIKLTCSNEKYQNIDTQSCRESIWSSNEKLKAQVTENLEAMMEEMADNLAADLGITEIRELLGIDAPGSADAATDVDLGSVIETIND